MVLVILNVMSLIVLLVLIAIHYGSQKKYEVQLKSQADLLASKIGVLSFYENRLKNKVVEMNDKKLEFDGELNKWKEQRTLFEKVTREKIRKKKIRSKKRSKAGGR